MTGEHDTSLEDARSLLESAAEFVELTVAREKARAQVLLLARRLTRDWKLTDEEAVRVAGELALRTLVAASGGGHGR